MYPVTPSAPPDDTTIIEALFKNLPPSKKLGERCSQDAQMSTELQRCSQETSLSPRIYACGLCQSSPSSEQCVQEYPLCWDCRMGRSSPRSRGRRQRLFGRRFRVMIQRLVPWRKSLVVIHQDSKTNLDYQAKGDGVTVGANAIIGNNNVGANVTVGANAIIGNNNVGANAINNNGTIHFGNIVTTTTNYNGNPVVSS